MRNYLKISLLISLFCTACGKSEEPAAPLPAETTSKPNILLIIADDLGIDAAPGYDIGEVKPNMPNLEQLAASGITFENAWAFPVCSPTRASMLTGRYGRRTGVLNAESASTISTSEKSLQAFLDENTASTYSHSVIGKWHLSRDADVPNQMGIGYYAGYLKGALSDYSSWDFTENGLTSLSSEYCTTKISSLAIDWINAQSKPWFCWLAYTAPHTPFHLPPADMHSQGNLPSDRASIDANPMPYFMAMTESIDHEIGRVLAGIPADERENTVIIFIGDNGTHRGVIQAPYRSDQGKGTLYEGGIHVPMIVAGKGVNRAGTRDNSLISSTDLFASIAELAGLSLPVYEDSHSFAPLLTAANSGTRTYNYSEILDDRPQKSGFTIRDAQYKLIRFDNGSDLFFDLLADPYEQNDLAAGSLSTTQKAGMDELIAKGKEIRGE